MPSSEVNCRFKEIDLTWIYNYASNTVCDVFHCVCDNRASDINMCGIALSLSGVHIEGHLDADTVDLEEVRTFF